MYKLIQQAGAHTSDFLDRDFISRPAGNPAGVNIAFIPRGPYLGKWKLIQGQRNTIERQPLDKPGRLVRIARGGRQYCRCCKAKRG